MTTVQKWFENKKWIPQEVITDSSSNITHINHVLVVQLPFMYLICDSM